MGVAEVKLNEKEHGQAKVETAEAVKVLREQAKTWRVGYARLEDTEDNNTFNILQFIYKT